ncbi:MAG: ATP-binding protein [Methanomicrobiales archaeon]
MAGILTDLLFDARGDVAMLDGLYQWVSTPTAALALRAGFVPDHGLIRATLSRRYGLDETEANAVFRRLTELVETAGLDFDTGYPDAEVEVRTWCESTPYLRDATVQRLMGAGARDRVIAWLFSRTRDDLRIWPQSTAPDEFQSRMARFLALLAATGIDATAAEVLDTLIALGCINPLEWVEEAGRRRERELTIPGYLPPVLDHLDPPDHPPAGEYLRSLRDRSHWEALGALADLMERGYATLWELSGTPIPTAGLVVEREGIWAINPAALAGMREEYTRMIAGIIAPYAAIVRSALTAIADAGGIRDVRETSAGRGGILWQGVSGDRPCAILCTGVLSGVELDGIRVSGGCAIVLSPLLTTEEMERRYRDRFCIEAESDPDWDGIFTGMTGDTPPPGTDGPARDLFEHLRHAWSQDAPDESPITVFLGRSTTGEEITWRPGTLQNGHLIITGGAGAGKTETLRCIAGELRRQELPLLMVDFHGDMASPDLQAGIHTIREGCGEYFNPLSLDPAMPDITPLRAISDFVDAVYINFPSLGIQQRNQLRTLLRDLYEASGIGPDPATWTRDVDLSLLEGMIRYSPERTVQSLDAYLSDIFDYALFCGDVPLSPARVLSGGTTVLDLHALPESIRFLFADLFLRSIYHAVQTGGEIPRNARSDRERFRLFVMVDEAKLLVSEKQGIKAVLNKYASELRKFGVGVILASQIADHFPSEVLANIETKFCMKAQNEEQARKNARFFGVKERDLLDLDQGEGILVLGREGSRVRILPTWKRRSITR